MKNTPASRAASPPPRKRFGDAMRAFLLLPALLSRFARLSSRRSSGKPYTFLSGGRNHNETCAGCIVKVHIVAQPHVERLQGRCDIVLPAVEAAIYERLYSPAQGHEQRGYCQGGSHDGELRSTTGKGAE